MANIYSISIIPMLLLFKGTQINCVIELKFSTCICHVFLTIINYSSQPYKSGLHRLTGILLIASFLFNFSNDFG